MVKVKPVQNGRTSRMSFSRINEVIGMPNLIEIQKNSYNWFLDEGLREVFHDIDAIEDYTGNLSLEFVDYRLDKHPKYTIKECKERDATYAAPLYVTARLLNKSTGEVKEQEIFMGDFPLMTDSGTFISNGRTCYRQPAGSFARRVLCFQQGPYRQGPFHRNHEPQPRRMAGIRNRFFRCILCAH